MEFLNNFINLENIFVQFAIVLSLASLFGYLVYRLKLPLVVAYLLAGVSLSSLSILDPHNAEIFTFLPEIGIAFVLFLIGMELDLREIKALGAPIVLSSIGQIIITTLAGYSLGGLLGFGSTESVLMGLGLSFSSTIVIIKFLTEKRDLNSLYGKLSVGIILIEDLVAIAVLMIVSVGSSTFNLGLQQSLPLLTLLGKAVFLFIVTYLLARFVLERIFNAVAKSVELLFLTALTWCFILTSAAVLLGFSVVIGAFLAGVALASSPYHLQIQGKIKPLRDFFVALFFVYLGIQAKWTDFASNLLPIVIFTSYALIVKPLLFISILGIFGFRRHTLFQTGVNISQISEFSLVLMLVGVQMGIASQTSLSVMAAVAVVSIIFSSIMIAYARRLYEALKPYLGIFEHSSKIHDLETHDELLIEDHIVVIGAHRVGGPIIDYLSKTKIPLVVMDFNPTVVAHYRSKGINIFYGDIGDPDVVDVLLLDHARLILSTATDLEDNEMILAECKRRKVKATIILRANDQNQANALKTLGADYVILPEQVSGDFLVNQLKNTWPTVRFHGLS